jgi:outer membrane receptor for ferrienterochelin and colicin
MSGKSIFRAVAVALALVLGSAVSAYAQTGRITGTVTDATTGEPLAGVQIVLEGTGRGTITQDNGRYFLINVQPGVYTVSAQLLGYATARRENVQVSIDVLRSVDFQMQSEAVALQEIIVEAERTPLIETRATGAQDLLSLQDIASLPVTDVNQALALRSGFLDVPQNTDVISVAEESRGVSAVRIRGGRTGETLTLIDGVPVNNFVFGGTAFQPNLYAIRQLDYRRGGFEPQYGNLLSGLINIATREGGTQLEGALEYRTSAIAGAMGSRPDELNGRHLFQGMLSGPVPGTDNRVRFALAGREDRSADRVLEFDDIAFNPRYFSPEFGFIQPQAQDLWRGWRSFGFDEQRDIFGKLTFLATPTAKLNLTAIDYQRQRMPFQFDMLLGHGQPVELCAELYGDYEMCAAAYGVNNRFGDLVPGSLNLGRRLLSASWDHTMGTTFYRAIVSRLDQKRETCNFFQGVCLEGWFSNRNFSENFRAPGVTPIHPASGTGNFWGGENLSTYMTRLDLQTQLTDNHNLQAGFFYQLHDLNYLELRDRGVSQVIVATQEYNARPWEAAVYFQDRIEYDFVTVNLGFRYDLGEAGGLFFANPLDPTAGTTAFDVCENPDAWQDVQVRRFDEQQGRVVIETYSANRNWNLALCTQERDTLALAALIATADDFAETKRRQQFSPRLGISFPVTETSSVFLNYGRYTQNPLYNNVFVGTGIGTDWEGTPSGIQIDPGTGLPYLGNPNLVIEQTTSYEVGYLAELMGELALSVILFSKDQTGLTGLRTGGRTVDNTQVFDPGVTYGASTPSYQVLVNQDFSTSRGFEIGLRRRVVNNFGFDLNYSFSRTMTNASPPDRQTERIAEGDPQALREMVSEIDQPHVFNGALRFNTGAEAPFHGTIGSALRHVNAALVLRSASGLPYTPTRPDASALGFTPDRREINSERAPATLQLDLQAQKDWTFSNLRYGAFLHVVNLTDRLNCIQVSPATGRCDAGAYDMLRRRVGNPVAPSATGLDRPQWIGNRRSILTGVRLSF